jgi:hypothetical protein
MPPPGQYNPKDDFVRKSNPSIVFGPRPPKPPKSAVKTDEPGPGAYTLPSTLESSKGVKMVGSRNEPKNRHESPGPGAYSQTFYEFGRSPKRNIILLSRPKEKSSKDQTPGPGAYEPESKNFVSSSKGIILLGRHKENIEKDPGPGPGAYDVRAKYFDDDIKKVSFGRGNRFTYYVSPSKDKHTKSKFAMQ